MHISFGSVNTNYLYMNTNSPNKKKSEYVEFSYPEEPSRKEVLDARIKKTISETFTIAFGVFLVYFAAKVKGVDIARKKEFARMNGYNLKF